MFKKIKSIFQGYSEEDTKNVRGYTIKKLQPVIKKYVTFEAEQGRTLPLEFQTDPAAWLSILRDIEYAFDWQFAKEFGEEFHTSDLEALKVHNERVTRGFELFGKHLRDLWN